MAKYSAAMSAILDAKIIAGNHASPSLLVVLPNLTESGIEPDEYKLVKCIDSAKVKKAMIT